MFKDEYNRREFIDNVFKTMAGFTIVQPWFSIENRTLDSKDEPLHDWTLWKNYRHTVKHPALTIKQHDIKNAFQNIEKYQWAKNYNNNILRKADYHLKILDQNRLQDLIEKTTPGDPLWTPCPSCREKGHPVHPHGLWEWDIAVPDQLKCTVCHEVFPHHQYPENIVLHSTWGNPQSITYYAGEPFVIFGFKKGRPSFTANIRSRKVQWCADAGRTLAEAFLLSGKTLYAEKTKEILLRFAECYPQWMVHVGYGEYADTDPKTAALHIDNLPRPEITPPPNQPDNKLWTAFWSAGRASGVGLESDFIRKVAEAYDFTCEGKREDKSPVYSEAERIKIEKDLLLESTILLVCDKAINNKSVSNRTAVALVGMCVGHPELVRFGLDGFEKTIYEWFLADGTTSESPFYGLMTLGGIWDLAQSAREYSDPPGYYDKKNQRFDHLNLYRDSGFEKVWKAFYNGLQGDLTYPAYADSFPGMKLDSSYLELMAANYPDHPEYLSLLKELCGKNLSKPAGPVPDEYYQENDDEPEMISLNLPYDLAKPQSPSSFSLYYRNSDSYSKESPGLTMTDWNPEALKIAHLRTGGYGRESLLLLSASHWGKHHEKDSLNISYWKQGSEILSDPGYLWDHPQKHNNVRTLAHNTVLIDQSEQRGKGRKGEITLFGISDHVKIAGGHSSAYEQARIYSRKTAIIDHGNNQNYVVDIFCVEGGNIQDYVFHIEDPDYSYRNIKPDASNEALYDFTKILKSSSPGTWTLQWKSDKAKCKAWSVSLPGETVFLSQGWGQRDWQNSDNGRTIPYIVRRTSGPGMKTFISIFEGYSSSPLVRDVVFDQEKTILKVTNNHNGTDYITWSLNEEDLFIRDGNIHFEKKGKFAVVAMRDNKVNWEFQT